MEHSFSHYHQQTHTHTPSFSHTPTQMTHTVILFSHIYKAQLEQDVRLKLIHLQTTVSKITTVGQSWMIKISKTEEFQKITESFEMFSIFETRKI